MSFYLDASVLLPLFLEERVTPAVERFLAAAGGPLIVSELGAAEVASGLARLTRMELLSRDEATAHLADFDLWRAAASVEEEIAPSDLRAASGLVRRFELGLRAPDAIHLAVCTRAAHDIVTLDARLAKAAREIGLVAVLPA